ncbi:DUF6732 family protein [Celeribacter litoreus]|uniref:DUF6732 family protein n=1 Tax=Celeribacter litoreus TaxID=2876714 RepID=UPI001CCF8C49|nr:DUF6732 family protein [Celeribacter litoreus]MCA0042339.1 hypothetical protein [Celeribacter litoreus]
MTRILALLISVSATPALAHIGHVGELAGHDHWLAGAAIGIAIGIAIWGKVKGKPEDEAEAEEAEAEVEAEPQGA